MTEKGEFKDLGDGRYQLSDGRIMTEAELDQALDNYFEQAELRDALGYAQRNQLELKMLYQAIAYASRGGSLLENPDTRQAAMAAIFHEHGEVLGETFANAVADVEHLSAVTLAALIKDINSIDRYYRESHQKGLSAAQAFVRSHVLTPPDFLEGATDKNFVQALIVASIVEWRPFRGKLGNKTFFVNPAAKDWDVLRRLENTPDGQDWIDMAFARSELDDYDILPD